MKNIASRITEDDLGLEPLPPIKKEIFEIHWRESDGQKAHIMGEGLNEFWFDVDDDDIIATMPAGEGYVFELANRPGDVIYHADKERAEEAYAWYDGEGYCPMWVCQRGG